MSTPDLFKRTPNDPDDNYWQTYLSIRPKYHLSNFYDIILDYHRQHGNASFTSAHDVACGPGQVAAELAKHFDQVLASDAHFAHLRFAQTQPTVPQNITWLHCSSEEVGQYIAPQSVDLVTVAEAMPLMDVPASLATFHSILKPGGTLAMWFYGRPHFLAADGETLDTAVNLAYTALADHLFAPAQAGNKAMFEGPVQRMHAWFDDVAIPAAQWDNVHRRKWNFDCDMSFASPTAGGLDGVVPQSQIGGHEECTSIMDRKFWSERWTAKDAHRFLSVNLPNFEASSFEGDEYVRLCEELEKAMGGDGVKRQVAWPAILILATQRHAH